MKLSLLSNRSDSSTHVLDEIPDAEIKMRIKDGSVTVVTDASGINPDNFHYLPSFFDNVFKPETREACIASLLLKIVHEEPRKLLAEQLIDRPKEEVARQIMWDSSETYKTELTQEDIEELKEELEVEDLQIETDDDEDELEIRIGYANFDITPFAYMIAKCDGVDSFRQMSRYRFAIGIGKHWFNFTDVRKKLTQLLKLKETVV